MKLVLFKDLLEDNAVPQYGIVTEGSEPEVICLCCGGTLEFGDYEIIETLPWQDVSAAIKEQNESKKDKYVVCMDEIYVRNSELLDTNKLPDNVVNNLGGFFYEDYDRFENLWIEMTPNPFIAIVEADSEESACLIAAEKYRYDSRCLYATKI